MIEKRSIQHGSLQTALGSSPQILLKQGLIDAQEFDFLLRFPVEASRISPVSFLSAHAWGAIKVPSTLLTCVIYQVGLHCITFSTLREVLQYLLFGYRQFLQWRTSVDLTEMWRALQSAGGRSLNPVVLKRKDFPRTGKIKVRSRSSLYLEHFALIG